jgi:S-adenosylmethionine:tRNA ribosyltransferase-isomerase
LRVELFDFDLPRERIAARPAVPRDAARLLVVGAALDDRRVHDLPDLLRPGDLLVLNDTRVIPARLTGRRGAARIEVTLLTQPGADRWTALARPAKRLAPGDEIVFAHDLSAAVEARDEGRVTLRFSCAGAQLRAALERHGAPPLPPYIPREAGADARDRADYQTIFAREEGAIAAPTAGLHFTEDLFARLAAREIGRAFVTLHVGPGTFRPVAVEVTAQHRMDAEEARLEMQAAEAVNRTAERGGRIVAVGSTSVRVLERAADDRGRVTPFAGPVDLFIVPGHRFRRVDLMLTNFHLPRSTLFMLVAAFGGLERMKGAYAHAIAGGYRFYSYGDACLIEPARP